MKNFILSTSVQHHNLLKQLGNLPRYLLSTPDNLRELSQYKFIHVLKIYIIFFFIKKNQPL